MNVIELVPPYADTELDSHFREKDGEVAGCKGHPPMPLQEYMGNATAIMEKDGVKEAAVGFADIGVSMWRGGLVG